jgi:hypothetical protein
MRRVAPYLALFAGLLALIFWLRPVAGEPGGSESRSNRPLSSRETPRRAEGASRGELPENGVRSGGGADRRPTPFGSPRASDRNPPTSMASARSSPPTGSTGSASRSPELPPGMGAADIPERYMGRETEFLGKLADIRDRRTPDDDGGRALPVRFTAIAPDTETGAVGAQSVFSPASGRIYAVFSCGDDRFRSIERVLVKWYSPEGENVWFESVGIRPGAPYNYVWWESADWLPGPYRVEIYGTADDPVVLAAGSFSVEEGIEFIGNLTVSPADEPFTVADFLVDEAVHARLPYRVSSRTPIRLKAAKMETGQVTMDRNFDLLPGESLLRVPLKGREPSWPPGTYDLEALDRNNTLRGRVRFVVN